MKTIDVLLLTIGLIIGFIVIIIIAILISNIVSDNKQNNSTNQHKNNNHHNSFKSGDSFNYLPNQEIAGLKGELQGRSSLSTIIRSGEYQLGNLKLPTSSGSIAEIDSVLLTRKGIFCVEIKTWIGHISGSDEDDKWLQAYDDTDKGINEWNNPVKQNQWHCKVLKKLLNDKFYIHNIVLFINLEDGSGIDSDYTYTIEEFRQYFNSLEDNKISDIDLRMLNTQLERYKNTETKKYDA